MVQPLFDIRAGSNFVNWLSRNCDQARLLGMLVLPMTPRVRARSKKSYVEAEHHQRSRFFKARIYLHAIWLPD